MPTTACNLISLCQEIFACIGGKQTVASLSCQVIQVCVKHLAVASGILCKTRWTRLRRIGRLASGPEHTQCRNVGTFESRPHLETEAGGAPQQRIDAARVLALIVANRVKVHGPYHGPSKTLVIGKFELHSKSLRIVKRNPLVRVPAHILYCRCLIQGRRQPFSVDDLFYLVIRKNSGRVCTFAGISAIRERATGAFAAAVLQRKRAAIKSKT